MSEGYGLLTTLMVILLRSRENDEMFFTCTMHTIMIINDIKMSIIASCVLCNERMYFISHRLGHSSKQEMFLNDQRQF